MYFIVGIFVMMSFILLLIIILFKTLNGSLIPEFLESNYAAKFKTRLSRATFQLMIDVRNKVLVHFQILSEGDGDKPLQEPFVRSPFHPCPPIEFIFSPPKEEIPNDNNNNGENRNRASLRLRAPRRRARNPADPEADVNGQFFQRELENVGVE